MKIYFNFDDNELKLRGIFSWYIYLGPVARSMVSVNQCLIPWQRIGFDTAQAMVKANHALSNSALAGKFCFPSTGHVIIL